MTSKTMSHADALRRLRAINEWLNNACPANKHGVWLDHVDDAFMAAWDDADAFDLECSAHETKSEPPAAWLAARAEVDSAWGITPSRLSEAARLLEAAHPCCINDAKGGLADEIEAWLYPQSQVKAPAPQRPEGCKFPVPETCYYPQCGCPGPRNGE